MTKTTYTCNPDLKGFSAFTDHTGTTISIHIDSTNVDEAIARAAVVLATVVAAQIREDSVALIEAGLR